jgi:hypothetical protein
MRRVPLFLSLAAALALGSAGPAHAGGRCAAKGSETARSTPKVRVYWKDAHLYGCVRESGVTRHLYGSDQHAGNQFDSAHLIRIAGYHVAFASSSFCTVCGQGGPSSGIHEIELRKDNRRHLGKVRRYDPMKTGVRVDALVLDHCGRIAYRAILFDSYDQDQDPDPALFTWVPGGHRRLVDRGAIERRSIALDPFSVYWVRDGKTREAPVEPPC